MTYPKLKPCPQCGELDWLEIYTYESGWKFVECDKCYAADRVAALEYLRQSASDKLPSSAKLL